MSRPFARVLASAAAALVVAAPAEASVHLTSVNSGGAEFVAFGGTAFSTTVNSGGTVGIHTPGVAIGR